MGIKVLKTKAAHLPSLKINVAIRQRAWPEEVLNSKSKSVE
jgi:hypothetical protein